MAAKARARGAGMLLLLVVAVVVGLWWRMVRTRSMSQPASRSAAAKRILPKEKYATSTQ